MNILIPIAKSSTKIKSVKHKSLIKIEKNVTLLEFQILKIVEAFKERNVVVNLLVDEYEDEIRANVGQILDKCPLSASIKLRPLCNNSLSASIKNGFQSFKNKECILIMGDVIFNTECITSVLDKNVSSFLIDKKNFFAKNEIGLWDQNAYVKYFCYSLPKKWMQICYLNSEFVKNYNAFCSDKLLVHEIFNKVLTLTSAHIIEHDHAKAVEIDKPKDIRLARQVFT